MRALSRTQTAFLLVAFGALTASGVAVGSAALDDPAAHRAAAGLPSRSPGPPTGYVQQQPGAPVTITRTSPGNGMVFDRVRVRNISEERITSVTFAAVIPDPLRSKPAIVVRSAPIETSLGPGEAAELSAQLLSMRELEGRPKPGPATMLGVVETRLAVSGKWTVRLRSDARDALEAFLLPGPFLSKALVGAERQAGSNENLCLDDRGFAYSEGGIVPVHDGPPIWARCDRGVWQPHELETRPASEH